MPAKEPRVGEEIRKHIMAVWCKKQKTEKQLKKDNDNSYLTSQWIERTLYRNLYFVCLG